MQKNKNKLIAGIFGLMLILPFVGFAQDASIETYEISEIQETVQAQAEPQHQVPLFTALFAYFGLLTAIVLFSLGFLNLLIKLSKD